MKRQLPLMEATFKFTIFLSQKSGEKSIRKTQWVSMLIMFSELIIQRSTITKDFYFSSVIIQNGKSWN